jgi:hypothetical protein
VQGHVYRFNIEVHPAQRLWRFTLRDLDWQSDDAGDASHTSDWIGFRNAATGAAAVGGNLHAGAFLQSIQTVRLSLDSVRITAADLAFAAGTLPAGFTFDPEIGRLSATLTSGQGVASISVTNPFGTTWRDYGYALPSGYEDWTLDYAWPAPAETTAAPDADPDNDGIPNLLEYALGSSPTDPADAPVLQVSSLSPQPSYPTLTFLRARADLTYEVLASSTLAPDSWTVIATNPGTVSLTESVTVSDVETVSDNPHRFFRLRVTP